MVEIMLGILIILLIILGLPFPYVQIGKKAKKGYKYTIGIISFLKQKLFVDDDVVERFNSYIEEFDNFIISDMALSFTGIFDEIISTIKLSKTEHKYFVDKSRNIQEAIYKMGKREKLNRKEIFKDTVREFLELVKETSKMVKEEIKTIQERKQTKLKEDVFKNYEFTAARYNDYLTHLRIFLERTSCYHNTEIKYYHLMQTYFVPDKIPEMGVESES